MSHVFLLKIIFPKTMMNDYKDISCISYISIKLELIFPMIEHTKCITIITTTYTIDNLLCLTLYFVPLKIIFPKESDYQSNSKQDISFIVHETNHPIAS